MDILPDIYFSTLKQYWGYDDFRPLQAEIIASIAAGKDTLALMPTGGGKSLCFQVPTIVNDGLCLVVTPLIALMKDQVQNLRQKGIKAETIYTGITQREMEIIFDNCQFGNYRFLYVSPERLESRFFQQRLQQLPVSLIAVDEAHCISQWGYDFRPSYLHIAQIRRFFPDTPVLALTATATSEVIDDIQDRLLFKEKNVLKKSFARKNISYVVRHTDDKLSQLLNILHAVRGSSIVYVRNRQKTRDISDFLLKSGISSENYHAGLSNQEKDRKQQEWSAGDVRVMVATNAFGMGIDKADVRTVIHLDLPDTLEAYFQEAGRAGRDEKAAYAVLLYNKDDHAKALRRIHDNYPKREFIKRVYEAIGDYLEVGLGSGLDHTFPFPFEEFCKQKHLPLLPTYSAIQILSQAGYYAYTEETETSPRIMFLATREELYSASFNRWQEQIVHYLLRQYTGIFVDFVYINENIIAERLDIKIEELNRQLISLAQQRVIRYIPRRKTPYITFTWEREALERLKIPTSVYEQREELYIKRITSMIQYAEQEQQCRSQFLLSYFGETDSPACRQCDVCRKQKHNL